jgi:hypothetical protein
MTVQKTFDYPVIPAKESHEVKLHGYPGGKHDKPDPASAHMILEDSQRPHLLEISVMNPWGGF